MDRRRHDEGEEQQLGDIPVPQPSWVHPSFVYGYSTWQGRIEKETAVSGAKVLIDLSVGGFYTTLDKGRGRFWQ